MHAARHGLRLQAAGGDDIFCEQGFKSARTGGEKAFHGEIQKGL